MRHSRRNEGSSCPATACIVPFSVSQSRIDGPRATLLVAAEQLQNESVELSEKMRLALAAQQRPLDNRRVLLEERRRQVAIGRSLIASCMRVIENEPRDGALGRLQAWADGG